jgi:hypothetical protein
MSSTPLRIVEPDDFEPDAAITADDLSRLEVALAALRLKLNDPDWLFDRAKAILLGRGLPVIGSAPLLGRFIRSAVYVAAGLPRLGAIHGLALAVIATGWLQPSFWPDGT